MHTHNFSAAYSGGLTTKCSNMRSCPYCAQTNTRKDKHGYCIVYQCFKTAHGDSLKKGRELIKTIEDEPDALVPLEITSHVSNFYNARTRKANSVIATIKRWIGFMPEELDKLIDAKHKQPWDKSIRW